MRQPKDYVEMRLCFCCFGSRGLREAILYELNLDSDYSANIYAEALRATNYALQNRKSYGLQVGRDYLAHTLEEMDAMVDFCKKNFPNCEDIIKLWRCGDGVLSFFRNIRFAISGDNDFVETQIKNIIIQLMQAGFKGCSTRWEEDAIMREMKRLFSEEKFTEQLAKLEIENYKHWRECFEIYRGGHLLT